MRTLLLLLFPALFSTLYLSAQSEIIPFGATWSYLDDGSDQGTAWRNTTNTTWKSGQGLFGYGVKDVTTEINSGIDPRNKPNKHKNFITSYFTTTFTLDNPNNYLLFTGKIKRDDGAVVYVNGVEVYRNNMPLNSISYNTLAVFNGDKGKTPQTFIINKSHFNSGTNIIAVEIHQRKERDDKDMAFDLQLSGVQAPRDRTPPFIRSINRQSPAMQTTSATSVIYRVTFSENVSGVDISDFSLNKTNTVNGTIASISGGGTTYDVTVNSITGTGNLRLDLNASGTGITDAAGNTIFGGFTTGQVYTIQQVDQTAPVVLSINRQSPATQTTSATSVIFRVTFSENVSGVDVTDFSLNKTNTVNGSIASISGSGTTYDVTVNSITGSGDLRLDLKSSGTAIIDAANNAIAGGFTSGQVYTIQPADQTAPSVVSINRQSPSTQSTSASSVTYRVTFSEAVNGVDGADFTVTTVNGSATGTVSGIASVGTDNTTYDVTVGSISGLGDIRLDLKASGTGITDVANNAISGGFTSGQVYTIVTSDQTAPTVSSINRQSPTVQLTNASSVTFRATFSENVSGVDATDFAVTLVSGTVTSSISSISGSGSIYDITVSSISGNGSIRLDLKTSGTGITDASNNAINGGFTTGQTYNIDQTAPVVNSINRQSPTNQITSAASVTFRVTFSESVSGVGTSDFTLTKTNTATGTIASVSGSGTTYDVTVNSISGAGDLRLDLNASGTGIADDAGNSITTGFTSGQVYTIQPADQTAPSVTSINRQAPTAQSTSATSVIYRAIFSEAVNGVDAADFSVTTVNGSATGTVSGVAPVGSDQTTYDVTISSITGLGDIRLDLKATGTGITDNANNAVSGGFTSGQVYTIVSSDQTAPTVNSINRQSPAAQITNASSVTFRATFSENVTGVDVSDFTLSVVSGTVTGSVTSISGSGSVYDITVNSINGNGSIRLDLKASGTGIADASNNAISGGFTTGQTYTIDQADPSVVSINRQTPATQTTSATSVTYRVTFSENVSGVDITDFTLTKTNTATGTIASISGSGTTYDVTVNSITGSGDLRLDLNASGTGITDAASNGISGGFTTGQVYTIQPADQTAPSVVSINRQSPSTQSTSASSVTYRAIFSEAVNGVDATDFALMTVNGSATGTVSGVTVVGTDKTTYDITVGSITGLGDIRLDLKSSGTGITDNANNAITGGFTSGQVYTIVSSDQTAPTVNSINRQSPTSQVTNASTVTFRATFSENVSGVDASDFAVTVTSGAVTSTVSSISGSGSVYDITVSSVSGDGTIRLDLKASGTGITDAANNAISGGFTTGQTYTIDQTAPVVLSINRQSPATQTTSATSVIFRVTFSENVTGADVSDFSLNKTNTVNGTIASISGSGSVYDVTVNSITGSGDLRLDLKSSGTAIIDAANNAIAGGFTSGQVYTIQPAVVTPGFTSVNPLTPFDISDKTADKPQGKVWKYDGRWWTVLASGGATKIFRLDGDTWTAVLTLASTNSRPDYWMVGNVVHFLLYKATTNSLIVSVEYDATNHTYKPWSQRTTASTILFPTGSQIGTLTVDGNGRMWVAADGTSDASVWWSDAPYTTFNGPITLATNITDDDMCTLTALPGKIGFFWSNQNTGLFGFRTHTNGSDPTTWSADEQPASQSAISGNPHMADNHMNLVAASDGTLYCAAKTSYNAAGLPELILLIRRPNGVWDNLHPVTIHEGTQPIVILNESQNKVKVVYTTVTNGGDIVYRESFTTNISFSSAIPLFSGGGTTLYHFASSTHQPYNPDVVIIATNLSTSPLQAVSVLATDGTSNPPVTITTAPASKFKLNLKRVTLSELTDPRKNTPLLASPNPFKGSTAVYFTLPEAGAYTLTLQDSRGGKMALLQQGWAEAGTSYRVNVDGTHLSSGLYIVSLQTSKGISTYKLLVGK